MATTNPAPWRVRHRIVFPVRTVLSYDEARNSWTSLRGEPKRASPNAAATKLTSALWRTSAGDHAQLMDVLWVRDAPALCSVVTNDGVPRAEVAVDVAAKAGLLWSRGTVSGRD